jgi:hypothetical protein
VTEPSAIAGYDEMARSSALERGPKPPMPRDQSQSSADRIDTRNHDDTPALPFSEPSQATPRDRQNVRGQLAANPPEARG